MCKKKSNYIISLPLFKAIVVQEVLEAIVGSETSLYHNKYSELLEVVKKALYKEEK